MLSVRRPESASNDIATKASYMARHGQDDDDNHDNYDLGFPGAVAAGIGSAHSPPGFGWRGVLPKSFKHLNTALPVRGPLP